MLGDRPRHLHDLLPHHRRVGLVAGEGALAALRLALALDRDLGAAEAAGATAERAGVLGAEDGREADLGGAGEIGDGLDLERRQALLGARSDPGDDPGRAVADDLEESLPGEHAETVGLVQVGGDLGDQAVRPEPDRAGQSRLRQHVPLDLAGARLRGRRSAQVDVGLVHADHLDQVAVVMEDLHDLRRGRLVALHVARDHDRLGTASPRDRDRQGRVHAELPGLVGGRHDDPSRGRIGRADDHRLTAQVGAAQQLDRHVEGVHVDVRDRVLPTRWVPVQAFARHAPMLARGGDETPRPTASQSTTWIPD